MTKELQFTALQIVLMSEVTMFAQEELMFKLIHANLIPITVQPVVMETWILMSIAMMETLSIMMGN